MEKETTELKEVPKGRTVKNLDEPLKLFDGESIPMDKVNMLGQPVFKKDEKGEIIRREQEDLTPRKAILLAMAKDPEKETNDPLAKLRAGQFARVFWNAEEVLVDSSDAEFIKNRLNFKWGGIIYTLMCDFLEGVSE